MNYFELFHQLKNVFNITENEITLQNLDAKIHNIDFTSDSLEKFPGGNEYQSLSSFFKALIKYYLSNSYFSNNYIFKMLEMPDEKVEENKKFKYSLLTNSSNLKSKGVIILLHGLNERTWNKYLPWAYSLHKNTNKAVILFPNAFHMNRAPVDWSDFRLMNEVSKERKKLLPDTSCGTFANAAISTRLQFVPQRFIFSGLQTYYDIINLVKDIRNGDHPYIDKDASVDLFGYSIGAFLSEIIIMSNPDNLFTDSRLFIFCGGSTLDLMNPVSKSILDSEAFSAISKFLVYDFEKDLVNDERLNSFFKLNTKEGLYFKSLLNIDQNKTLRESRFKELSGQIYNLSLRKDSVMPFEGVSKTLMGGRNNSGITSQVVDFDYPYAHETPFPLLSKYETEINKNYNAFINTTCSFLN